ncbi:MAG: translation initiation factor IF-3 [Planctomycetota bacterium]
MRINEEIQAAELRVISEEGEQLGIMSPEDALAAANDRDLDLVEVAPDGSPPVCRIMNYGKFKYEQQKREQAARKRSHGAEMKELRLGRSIRIEDHDLEFKIKKAREFLEKGHRLQVFLQIRGRELAHAELGADVLKQFAEDLEDVAKVEMPPRMDRRRCTMLLAPLQTAKKPGKSKKAKSSAKDAKDTAEESAKPAADEKTDAPAGDADAAPEAPDAPDAPQPDAEETTEAPAPKESE